MGNRGRFGKYGEIRRIRRLQRSRQEKASIAGTACNSRAWQHRGRPKKEPQWAKGTRIKIATKLDRDFILGLAGRVFCEYGPYEKILEEWMETGMTHTVVCVEGKKRVGFAMINTLPWEYGPQHETELLAIAVEPSAQGSGVGHRLLLEIEKHARKLGVRKIHLHTASDNARAKHLFSKAGFEEVGVRRNFYPRGQDAVVMTKELLPKG